MIKKLYRHRVPSKVRTFTLPQWENVAKTVRPRDIQSLVIEAHPNHPPRVIVTFKHYTAAGSERVIPVGGGKQLPSGV